MNFQIFKLVLEKAEEQEIKLPTSTAAAKSLQLCSTLCNPIDIRWIIEKAREFQKNIYFCFSDCAKAFDCVDHNKLWKILKEMGIPDLPLEKSVCRSGSNSYNWTWNNRLIPNRKKSVKAVYCHPAYLTYM